MGVFFWTQCSSRSSKVIDPDANRKPILNFLLVINSNFGRSYLVPFSKYWRIKLENSFVSSTPPLFDGLTPPLGGIPLEFLYETYPAKTRGMRILYGQNCVILTSTVFDLSWMYKNGRNFATGLPIDVMFGSTVGVSGWAEISSLGAGCCRA